MLTGQVKIDTRTLVLAHPAFKHGFQNEALCTGKGDYCLNFHNSIMTDMSSTLRVSSILGIEMD